MNIKNYLKRLFKMRNHQQYEVLKAVSTAGAGKSVSCSDFAHVIFSLATDGTGSAELIVKFQGSIKEGVVDFDSPQTASNMWDYIQVIDLENGKEINGSDGISIENADDYRQFEANINGLKHITAKVTGYGSGAVTVNAFLFDNN